MIHILDNNFNLQAILKNVTSSARTEAINDENTLDFTTFISEKTNQHLTRDSIIELDNDYFDIALLVKEQKDNGSCIVQVETEHISYRLNDPEYNMDTFAATGTPTAVLTSILSGTPFTVGTVEFTSAVTYSATEKKSRRALLMEFAEYIGAELDFDKFSISLVVHRGNAAPQILSPNKNIKIVSEITDKRNRDSEGNPVVSYTCTPIGTNLSLGDEVLLTQKTLSIQERLRIVKIVTNPYDKTDAAVEIANRINTLEDDFYRIETSTVVKDKLYYGASIGPERGFESIRSDKKARAYLNADNIVMQSGDGSGTSWVDKLFFDPDEGEFIFNGTIFADNGIFRGELQAATGTFAGSITIGTGDDVFKANGSDGIWLGDADFEDAPFSVDLNGNLIAHNGQFIGGTITGSDYYSENDITHLQMIDDYSEAAGAGLLIYSKQYYASETEDPIIASITRNAYGTDWGSWDHIFLTTNEDNANARGDWRFVGNTIGFFGAAPVSQQTATKIPTPSTATAYDCAIKINGILEKLKLYGLFDLIGD